MKCKMSKMRQQNQYLVLIWALEERDDPHASISKLIIVVVINQREINLEVTGIKSL